MKWRTLMFAVTVLCVVVFSGMVEAQDEQEKEGAGKTVVVKKYAQMTEDNVYRLSDNMETAAVRFQATFKELMRPKPRVLDGFRMGRVVVDPLLIFETQGEVVCLITRRDLDLIRRALDLVRGQQIWVEGTVLPEYAGFKMVIVDDIKFDLRETRDVRWEVSLKWPGQKPKIMRMPGTYTLRLPVPGEEGKEVEFQIEVRRVRVSGAEGKGEEQ